MKNVSQRITIKISFILFFTSFFQYSQLHADTNIIDQITSLLETTTEQKLQDVPIVKHTDKVSLPEKEWTLMVYISADNDLRNFAIRNIKEMAKVGSNQHINIIVHLDIRLPGNQKATKRYYIKKDQILHLNADDPQTQRMDSGNPETLISFCQWSVSAFPATHYGLILWNHGTGAIDPRRGRIIKLSDLFTFNPQINKVEVDRSIGFFDLIDAYQQENRGICWDDTTGNYLTNQNLDYALNRICTEILGGQKLDLIGFDACLMQMTEVGNITKHYADIMIASQEVILGTGWPYIGILKPFEQRSLTSEEFSTHIVNSYRNRYNRITNDYTLSALDLEYFSLLEENINLVSGLLVSCLKKQKNKSVKKAIATSRNRMLCTHFDEPSFIDLHHFYANLLATVEHFALHNKQEEAQYKQALTEALAEGCHIIEAMTIANVTGKNLSKAKGISIYFPTNRIYFSYRKLPFCQSNNWIVFLTQYLNV
ncbi:clostripain-related cysteine peptidase [Candidatus Dependentiae bacterium]